MDVSDAGVAAALEPAAEGGNGDNSQRQGAVSPDANLPYASRTPDQQVGMRPSRTFDRVINRLAPACRMVPSASAVEGG